MKKFSRRDFMKVSAMSACTLAISTSLTGCGSNDKSSNDNNISFKHGVASGDPLSDKVIIWTRVTPEDEDITTNIEVLYEVATDKDFTNIFRNGVVNTNIDIDFTVKIDVQELKENTRYFYRFKVDDQVSEVGTTKTLPTGEVEQVKMAVFVCSNYPNGYFNAYTDAAKIEYIDVSIHLGDYIYEYGMYKNDDLVSKVPAYATSIAKEIKRALPADNMMECITLKDYRKRYALYHTDSGNKAIHAAFPMIVVWDDHEIANDTYKGGAQNHDQTEGLFSVRAQRALQAYFEWLPIRPASNEKAIFRSFDFGNLVSLHMLETRLFARDKQLDYADYYDSKGNFRLEEFLADFSSKNRDMIGDEQLLWLSNQLKNSKAIWQVLGQQVLMGKMNIPIELLSNLAILNSSNATDEQKLAVKSSLNQALKELATIKFRILSGDNQVTQEQKARLSNTLPYNLDAWDGYFYEREQIFGAVKALDKNLVVLAGDTHNAWANDLKDANGDQIGVEFAVTSVTSPGMEEYVGLKTYEESIAYENAIVTLIDDLKYFNAMDRGYMIVTFTPNESRCDWFFVDQNRSTNYTLLTQREKSLRVIPNAGNRTIVEVN